MNTTNAGLQQQSAQLQTMLASNGTKPASGDHGFAHPAPMPMPVPTPMPYYNPFDQIQNLLEQLRMAIEQLSYPHQKDIFPPDPYQHGCGMDHGIPPYEHPIPIDPIPPTPQPQLFPKKGQAVGSVNSAKTGRTAITVSSVRGSYGSRGEAITEAKRLAGGKGDDLFGVVANHQYGTFTVVGLKSSAKISAMEMGTVASRDINGLMLDTIAFDAKTARRVNAIEASPGAITPPMDGPITSPPPPTTPGNPSPPAPPAPPTL